MKRLICIIVLVLVSNSTNSQSHKNGDGNKMRLYGTFDFRNSGNQYNLFEYYGLKFGVENKKIRVGVAYHILHKNLFSIITNDNFFELQTISHHQTKYHVASIFTELILHQTPRWELIAPIHFGIGLMELDANKAILNHLLVRSHDLDYILREEWVESAVVSLKANYRIVKWAGVTTGFGYNQMFSNDKTIRASFSKLFFSFGLKLFFDEFANVLKSKEYRKNYLWEPNFIN